MTTHIAAIGTASDVVEGEVCDLVIATAAIAMYRIDGEGNEVAEPTMGDEIVYSVELTTRTDDDDLGKVVEEADQVLRDQGWNRTGDWDCSHNAMYASVEPA